MLIREHEVSAGETRCKHCGAIKPGPESTCIPRHCDPPARDSGRREPACDDADVIFERIGELRREMDEALNRTDE
jgi:hypothetical protein